MSDQYLDSDQHLGEIDQLSTRGLFTLILKVSTMRATMMKPLKKSDLSVQVHCPKFMSPMGMLGILMDW